MDRKMDRKMDQKMDREMDRQNFCDEIHDILRKNYYFQNPSRSKPTKSKFLGLFRMTELIFFRIRLLLGNKSTIFDENRCFLDISTIEIE